ncbi:MAG TPA: helix-turn-helix transcriptional regulator [Advenella sp.]|nr:helix-turn-helix transcriptional regulator [Advenella sp.]
MADTDINLPRFNQVLPQVLPNAQLRSATQSAVPFRVNLSAFALTARASVVMLQATRAELVLASSALTSVASKGQQWFLLYAWEAAEFTNTTISCALQAGDLLLVHSSNSASLCPRINLNCTIIALQEPCVGHWQSLFGRARNQHFRAESGWARLLSVYLRELNEPFMERIATIPSDQAVCLETVLSLAVMMIGQQINHGLAGRGPDRQRQARHKLYTDITLWLYFNFGEVSLTGKKVAREFHISVRTLHKLFREFNDSASFAHYLNDIRMRNARNMLRDSLLGHLNVGDIGWLCGFADPAHFGKVFKKHHSITPGQMRDMAHGNDEPLTSC